VKRFAFHEFHHQKRRGSSYNAEVCYRDNVGVTDGGGCKCLLSKTSCQHRIVSYEIREDDLDRVLRLQEDVPALEHETHAALAQSTFEEVSIVQSRLPNQGGRDGSPVVRTVIGLVREATLTSGTFLHWRES
jgi:hypothetical protein